MTLHTNKTNRLAIKKAKRRTRINPMSARRKALLSDYKILRAEFLGTKTCCDRVGCDHRPTEVHHVRGRVGGLMLDRQFWLALCSKCHRWVHDHPVKARAEGLLGPWGRQVRDDS